MLFRSLEEAEQLCKNIAIIDQGRILVDTSMKDLLTKLDVQSFILDLDKQLNETPDIKGYTLRLDDPTTLVASITRDQSINYLFEELSRLKINVKSMRNEANRLEELFVEMVNK